MKSFQFLAVFFCLNILESAVYEKPSPNFCPKAEIVALYIEDADRILLLHRQENKSQGNKWGIPAGKVGKGETLKEALIREVFEETGYDFSNKPIEFLQTVFVEHNAKDHIVYHMFKTKMPYDPALVKICFDEHKGFTWVTPQDSFSMSLIDDEEACLRLTYGL